MNDSNMTCLLKALGLAEPPMGIFYTTQPPARGYAPKAQVSLEQLAAAPDGQMHWNSCVLGKIRRARRDRTAAYFDTTRYGCLGGAYFMGFKPDYENFEPALLSTGIPGQFPGELYVDSPDTGKRFYDGFRPTRAGGPVLVIKPLDLFKENETPELVAFFPDPRALIGLNGLTTFVTCDPEAVRTPFGVGCCNLISWPRKFLSQGQQKAVIGCFDINCLKYLKQGELTYVVPFSLFDRMLDLWPDSLLGTRAWQRLTR